MKVSNACGKVLACVLCPSLSARRACAKLDKLVVDVKAMVQVLKDIRKPPLKRSDRAAAQMFTSRILVEVNYKIRGMTQMKLMMMKTMRSLRVGAALTTTAKMMRAEEPLQ